jgi:hypothetical protein
MTAKTEARAVSVMHASVGLKSSAVIRDADGTHLAVTFTGFPQGRALALTNAIVRLLNGASVFDGADLGVIRDALWTARGEAGTLAPEAQPATNAIGAIETALGHLERVA